MKYNLTGLDECYLILTACGVFVIIQFPRLIARIIEASCLASVLQDGDFKEYSQTAAETFLFHGLPNNCVTQLSP